MSYEPLPTIIQGGMGIAVSGWRLARAVSETGQLGVVSGTAIDTVIARRLQCGDAGGHVRRALEHFPIPGVADRILDRYFVPGGRAADKPYRANPVASIRPSRHLQDLLVAGNFVEVFLAREGHDNPVGINFLEKIQLPTLPSIYGAMLAGVSWILMGAGIPRTIPGVLDRLAAGLPTELQVYVAGAGRRDDVVTHFDPQAYAEGQKLEIPRPRFAAIVSSATLATMLKRKSTGKVDGFVVEGFSAGGHNAPPRGKMKLTEDGEPIYGERDIPDIEAIHSLGLPFWLAGSCARPELVADAVQRGATGVQVGTVFAYCDESDLDSELKKNVLAASREGTARVFTDPVASPAGFPFKVVQINGSLSEEAHYEARPRICDLGYLRHAYEKEDGTIGWRCPAEPLKDYLRKGGDIEDTKGRKCICNALMANISMGQLTRDGQPEGPLVTSGDDVAEVARLFEDGALSYTAADVVKYLRRDLVHEDELSQFPLAEAEPGGNGDNLEDQAREPTESVGSSHQ
jgi:nitronate monooxygenase